MQGSVYLHLGPSDYNVTFMGEGLGGVQKAVDTIRANLPDFSPSEFSIKVYPTAGRAYTLSLSSAERFLARKVATSRHDYLAPSNKPDDGTYRPWSMPIYNAGGWQDGSVG